MKRKIFLFKTNKNNNIKKKILFFMFRIISNYLHIYYLAIILSDVYIFEIFFLFRDLFNKII